MAQTSSQAPFNHTPARRPLLLSCPSLPVSVVGSFLLLRGAMVVVVARRDCK
jgi:hypothetical protein